MSKIKILQGKYLVIKDEKLSRYETRLEALKERADGQNNFKSIFNSKSQFKSTHHAKQVNHRQR